MVTNIDEIVTKGVHIYTTLLLFLLFWNMILAMKLWQKCVVVSDWVVTNKKCRWFIVNYKVLFAFCLALFFSQLVYKKVKIIKKRVTNYKTLFAITNKLNNDDV